MRVPDRTRGVLHVRLRLPASAGQAAKAEIS